MAAISPTIEQVRAHYEALGHEVRIDDEGHVEYRPDPDRHPGANDDWLEGRWISEYRIIDGGVHLV